MLVSEKYHGKDPTHFLRPLFITKFRNPSSVSHRGGSWIHFLVNYLDIFALCMDSAILNQEMKLLVTVRRFIQHSYSSSVATSFTSVFFTMLHLNVERFSLYG